MNGERCSGRLRRSLAEWKTMRVAIATLVVLALNPFVRADDVPGLVPEKPSNGIYVETERGFMVPYTATIPGTTVTFEMVPVPGGEFLLGSPDSEAGRNADEGPQVLVKTRPFWMGKNELRWAEYKLYMSLYNVFKKFETAKIRLVTDTNKLDAITAPTELYMTSFTFEFGEEPQLPAVTMTQYAARQYTKWLSAVTTQQYRLPTEAEWEYAARAGTKTAYSFGDDGSQLAEYAFFAENSKDTGPRKVGLGKPNAFGLSDMYGNVAEWCHDELFADGYARLKDKIAASNGQPLTVMEAYGQPTVHYPRVCRGGSWQNTAAECRSAAKLGSDVPNWKLQDPNLPLSPWWFTDDPARGVGFRLLRSLDELPREEIETFWNIDNSEIQVDVDARISGGRGVYGIVDKDLPEAVTKLKASEKKR